MEKIFDKFIKLLDNLPVYAQILGLVLLFFLFLVVRLFSSEKMQQMLIARFQKKMGKLTESHLQLHRLFTKEEIYQGYINNIQFSSTNKTTIFRSILKVKLETDILMAREFINKHDFDKIDKDTLCGLMMSTINCMVKNYEAKVMQNLDERYGTVNGQCAFDVVMNSPGGWREKRVDRLNRIIFQIDNYLRNSQIFDNNIERVEYFLSEIQYALRMSILEAEKMFENFKVNLDDCSEKIA